MTCSSVVASSTSGRRSPRARAPSQPICRWAGPSRYQSRRWTVPLGNQRASVRWAPTPPTMYQSVARGCSSLPSRSDGSSRVDGPAYRHARSRPVSVNHLSKSSVVRVHTSCCVLHLSRQIALATFLSIQRCDDTISRHLMILSTGRSPLSPPRSPSTARSRSHTS